MRGSLRFADLCDSTLRAPNLAALTENMQALDRLLDAWMALLGKPGRELTEAQSQIVALKREVAQLTLDLRQVMETVAAKEERIEELQAIDLDRSDDALGRLLADLAAPLSQLRMQESLISSGKEISGLSVMKLAQQLAGLIERAGLEPIGETGGIIPFDNRCCEPLGAASDLEPGQNVTVRFVGYRRKDMIVRKALVERSR